MVSCPVLQTSACEYLVVLVKHVHSWVPVHAEGITVSTVGLWSLNTLFKQFLFTRKFENQWTQNRPKVIHIVSSPLQKSKVLASDSGTQELHFDVCLKLCREALIFHFREKTYGVRSGWQTISTTGGWKAESLCFLRQLNSFPQSLKKEAHHRRAY